MLFLYGLIQRQRYIYMTIEIIIESLNSADFRLAFLVLSQGMEHPQSISRLVRVPYESTVIKATRRPAITVKEPLILSMRPIPASTSVTGITIATRGRTCSGTISYIDTAFANAFGSKSFGSPLLTKMIPNAMRKIL